MSIALIGNPNCGKTTLFNLLTGSTQRVGNWSGVTVERKTGIFNYHQQQFEIVDLPGTYAIESDTQTTSQDEMVTRDYVLNNQDSVIINIIDATNLQRSLYLTFQLLDLNQPLIVVLNMIDAVAANGEYIAVEKLAALLGCPVVAISSTKKKGLPQLYDAIEHLAVHKHIATPTISTLDEPQAQIINNYLPAMPCLSCLNRWRLLDVLMGNQFIALDSYESLVVEQCRHDLSHWCGNEVDVAIASSRYEAIDHVCKAVIETPREASVSLSEKIDKLTLGRITGMPFFCCVMYLMFIIAVKFGAVFVDFFEILFSALFVDGTNLILDYIGAPQWLKVILADGIGNGIQTVSTFIPVIAAMFFCLSFLEDSGYLARAAMVVDRGMRAIGLPGKAFVPMLVGFGCGVPAMMSTRTLESTRDRIMSICMIPFMSCNARLPVYALLSVIFFPHHASTVVFILYLLGIAVAIFTGFVLKSTLLKGTITPFIMEMPVYRLPTLKSLFSLTWQRLHSFILRAGKAIIIMVTVLSLLNSVSINGSLDNQNSDRSMLATVSKTITPLFAPMGISQQNWPATVGIFTGIFAKEAVIATLNSLYSMTDEQSDNEPTFSLKASFNEAIMTTVHNLAQLSDVFLDPLGLSTINEDIDTLQTDLEVSASSVNKIEQAFGSSGAAMAYLIFILLYTPCVAALGTVYREAGLKWTGFVAIWTLLISWLCATGYYQFTLLGSSSKAPFWLVGLFVMLALVILLLSIIGKYTSFSRITRQLPIKSGDKSHCR